MASESDLIKAMIPEGTFEKVLARQKSVKKKPAKQEAPVVQSFSNGGEVMPLPLSGVSIPKPSSYGELFTDIDSTVRGLGKGALSVGLGLPGDLLALLSGAGSFIGIPGESFFRPEEERGFLPRLKRAAGTVDRISSGIGSLMFEEAAINRLLENEAGLSDRDLALQIEALKTGAFTGPLTPAALGLKAAPKLADTFVRDAPGIVEEGIGSLDPVKEAAQFAREEKKQTKKARQEAAAFVPDDAKNTLGSSEVKADFVEQLGLGYGDDGVPRLKEFFEIADNIKYNFRSGRLLFNPDSGLGMSQANKPRNSKSVLNSFERLGVSQNELKQTGLLDYLNKNKEVTLSDLQNVFNLNKPRLKMVRINENNKFRMSDIQRLTPNPKDGDVGVGYISVDVVGHAHFDEGQPGLDNLLSKEAHYRGIETVDVPFPNPMMHTRGVTVQFDAGTKNAEKFPNGAQIIEEVQDDYLGDFRMAENLSSAEERAKLQGKISELDEVIYRESDELMNILNDDFLLNEIARLTYRDGTELGNTLGPNKTEMPAEEYIAGNMRFQFHEFNTRNAFDNLQFNDLGEPVYVDEGGLSFGDMLKAQGVVTSPTGTKIAPKQFIKNPTELNAQMIFQFADELESIRSGERRRDGLTRDDLSTPLLNVDISKLRLLAEKVHERKRQTDILSKADELAALGVIDSSIKTKINELIPAYREKVNQFKTEIAELEQSVNNYNKITMDNTLRNEAKIDSVNNAIKNIEEKVPADSNEKVRYLPRGKFGMEDTVLLSREEALDRYADDRAFYENQLKEIRERGDINNPEASALTEKLGNKRKELAEYDSKFREDNPEITNFIENKKITETKEFKIDPVFKDQTGTAMYMLKQEVAVALEKGLSGVILPNYTDITSAGRGGDPAHFKRTYDDAMKKLQEELKEYGFEVGTIDVPYIHQDEIIDSKPSMYIKFPEGLDNFEPEVKLAKGGLVRKRVV